MEGKYLMALKSQKRGGNKGFILVFSQPCGNYDAPRAALVSLLLNNTSSARLINRAQRETIRQVLVRTQRTDRIRSTGQDACRLAYSGQLPDWLTCHRKQTIGFSFL